MAQLNSSETMVGATVNIPLLQIDAADAADSYLVMERQDAACHHTQPVEGRCSNTSYNWK